jgi:hypothetical protein
MSLFVIWRSRRLDLLDVSILYCLATAEARGFLHDDVILCSGSKYGIDPRS